MSIRNKSLLLNELESRVEKHLKETIQIFQNLEEEVLIKDSINGGWSIAQCLEHLNYYGNYYLPLIENGIAVSKVANSNEVKFSRIGKFFIKVLEPESGKRKLKAFKSYSPPSISEPYPIIAEFINQQERLLNSINKARNMDLNKIKIPVSIIKLLKLNIGEILNVLVAHNDRHFLQAKRNLP